MLQINTINKSALQFSISAIPIVRDICNPLKEYLGINYFSYMRIYNNCNYIALISGNEEYNKKYFEHIKTADQHFIKTFEMTSYDKPNFFLWPISYKKLSPIMSLLDECNIWHGFNITYRKKEYCEVFWFAFSKQSDSKAQFYYQNLQLLIKFSHFFKVKIVDLIENEEKSKIALYPEKFDLSYKEDANAKQFLAGIDQKFALRSRDGHLIYLTKRESESLKLLANNKSVKEVAWLLNLSPRTVECHINNMKQKLGIGYKSQLLNTFYETYC